MAVLVEGISVVLNAKTLISRFPGGWNAFSAQCPNQTLCADGELVRVGFMAPEDVQEYVHFIEGNGLHHLRSGQAVDLVVADQRGGLCSPAKWVEFGRINWEGNPGRQVAACRLVGSANDTVYTPDGWTYENSLSAQFLFLSSHAVPEYLDYLGKEQGVEVYRDIRTGKKVFIGRTGEKS